MALSIIEGGHNLRKVLLILSSVSQILAKFENCHEDNSIAPASFGISRIREEKVYPEVWVAIVLFVT